MPKIPGVNHLDAIRALEKAGFWIARQGRHAHPHRAAPQSCERDHDGWNRARCRTDGEPVPGSPTIAAPPNNRIDQTGTWPWD